MDNKVGYISLSILRQPFQRFQKALLDLKKQGATSLVIDLRNNGGGLLDEAVEIANYFLAAWKSNRKPGKDENSKQHIQDFA